MGKPQEEAKDGIERPQHCLCGLSSQPLSPLRWVGPVEGCGAAAVGAAGMPQPFLGGHMERWVVSLLGGWVCGVGCLCRG